ncbi:MAG: glycosyltransferase family 2 protein [Candidatus Gastranaerophilales bacterium]|nr:glycosyltransferase family 2 protein [Candidatus Gastranaerophilales bacterium]
MDVDVIIPLYKPGKELFKLLELIERQSVPIHQIILMNTEEKYFEQLIYGNKEMEHHRNVRVLHLSKREFDHGRTRRRAVQKSQADIFVMMTQDVVPVDEYLIERLTVHLTGENKVAAAYARQLPKEDCSVLEQFTRKFNYPPVSRIQSRADLETMGIKTYMCSNVCAAYRRDIYEELGGFVRHTIFNEDMIYAAAAVKAGYSIAYEADACVYHSHNYSNRQQFHRNFDLGVSQAEHPEVFAGISSESEGKRLVKEATAYLKEQGKKRELPHFYMQCISKYAGYLLGKHYRKLPKRWVLAFTSNKEYWQ